MDINVTLISCDVTKANPISYVTVKKETLLSDLQQLVGGHIERVPMFGESPARSLIVNEEGLLMNLPPNFAVKAYYDIWCVGDAVIIDTKDLE